MHGKNGSAKKKISAPRRKEWRMIQREFSLRCQVGAAEYKKYRLFRRYEREEISDQKICIIRAGREALFGITFTMVMGQTLLPRRRIYCLLAKMKRSLFISSNIFLRGIKPMAKHQRMQ